VSTDTPAFLVQPTEDVGRRHLPAGDGLLQLEDRGVRASARSIHTTLRPRRVLGRRHDHGGGHGGHLVIEGVRRDRGDGGGGHDGRAGGGQGVDRRRREL